MGAAPSSDWVWSSVASPSPSCTSPPVQNNAQMCSGDPTSVVTQGSGQPQCLAAKMYDCKFNLHAIQQLDFDINMIGCGGTWAAPLWMSPDHWEGGGASGEIDMMENCPADAVWNNFAGGGSQVKVAIADPNSFQGHTTMWIQADGGSGTQSVHVKTCDPSSMQGGSCPETGAVAYLHDIFGLNGCKRGNCMYTMISDIWNGNSGDAGYAGCAGGHTHLSSGCGFSVTNIRFKATPGTFIGKCSSLVSATPPAPPTPVPPTPVPPTPVPPPPTPSGAACAAHPACSGLVGNCCPTIDGVILACCNQFFNNQSHVV